MQALHAAGAPLPAPIRARGMLDSGTSVTAVAPWLLAQLNATPGSSAQTWTATGSVSVRFYRISFTIYDPARGGSDLTRPDWAVTNLSADPEDVDILFGLDLLREIHLIVDGPGRMFTLVF